MAEVYTKVSDTKMKITEQTEVSHTIDRKALVRQIACTEANLTKLKKILAEMDKLGITKEAII